MRSAVVRRHFGQHVLRGLSRETRGGVAPPVRAAARRQDGAGIRARPGGWCRSGRRNACRARASACARTDASHRRGCRFGGASRSCGGRRRRRGRGRRGRRDCTRAVFSAATPQAARRPCRARRAQQRGRCRDCAAVAARRRGGGGAGDATAFTAARGWRGTRVAAARARRWRRAAGQVSGRAGRDASQAVRTSRVVSHAPRWRLTSAHQPSAARRVNASADAGYASDLRAVSGGRRRLGRAGQQRAAAEPRAHARFAAKGVQPAQRHRYARSRCDFRPRRQNPAWRRPSGCKRAGRSTARTAARRRAYLSLA